MITGSYREEETIEIWDLRKKVKLREIDFYGPGGSDELMSQVAINFGQEEEKKGEEGDSSAK